MNDRKPNDLNLDAPEKLRAALARTQSRRVVVPPSVDDTVMRAAREQLLANSALVVPPKVQVWASCVNPELRTSLRR